MITEGKTIFDFFYPALELAASQIVFPGIQL